MEAMQRRLQASLEKVAQLVHDELAALLSEAVNTPVDLSHPQFGAVASRVARLTASVETVYRQAAVELIMPHLQFEDADARQEHQLAPGGAEAASALPPKAPGSTAGSKPDGSADHSHLMMRSQSSATRLLSQCTQEGLGMSSEDGDSDAAGSAGPAAGTPAAGGPLPGATSSADRLRKLSPSSLTEGGASGSLPRITSSIAASDIDAMQRLVLVNGAGEERAASVSAAGAKPDSGMGPVSQPLRPTLSTGAQPTSTTSLSSPTGANMADLMFNGSGGVPQGAPWAGSSPAFAAMEAMVVRQAADSQVNSRINSKDGLGMGKDGTMLPPAAPPVPEAITNSLMAGAGNAPAAGSSQQLATQEYLKSVHAALTAANLVMGDAGAMTNLSETIQRAAALNKRDSSASGTASHTASGKLLQLVTNRSTPEQQVQQLQQQHSGRPVSPYTAQSEVQVLSAMDGSGIITGGFNEAGSSSARLTPTTSGPVNVGQAGQVQLQVPGGYLTLDEQQQQLLQQQQQQQQAAMMQQLQQQQQQLQQQQQQYVVSDVQRGNPQNYAQRTVSAQQLQLPMENLVLSSHRPTHGNAQHGLQVMDLYAQPGQQQNLLTLNSAGMITGMTDGAGNGGGHAMSGPLPVVQGDTLLMEPLTSYVPDPNFSLFDLQPQNAQQVGGYNPNSAQQTLSMFAAAANAENAQVQVRAGHSPHGQPLSQPIDLQGTPSFTTLNLGSVINSAGQLVNISANNPGGQLTLQGGHGDGVHSEPLPLLVNLNQLGGGTLTLGNGNLPPGTASISAGSLVAGRSAQLSPGASPDPGLMQGQTISLSNLLPGGAARMQGMGLAMQPRAGVSVGALGGNLAGLSVGLAGVPVSPLPLRVQDLPGRFKILPAVVQQRILALCRTNPVIGVRDFDDKVVSKLSLLVDSWGVDQALAMLDHLEHRMRTKQGAMKNGPGYLDVAVCSHLDMLKAQGACPKSMKLEDYAAQVLAAPVYHELCQAVNTNRWLAWEHFDQGIVQLIKKLPTESAVEKLQEITYHSFKNVDNIKGCIMSILNSKIREDRRRQ